MPLTAVTLRWLFDAALGGRRSEAIAAGLLVALLAICMLTLSHFAHVAYFELSALNLLRYDRELIAVSNGSPGLDVHENAAHADRLGVLDEEVQQTRMTLEALLRAAALLVGMAVSAVLLALLKPMLLLLPLIALPPLLISRRAEQLVDEARSSSAEPARLAWGLFRLATTPGPAKELRVFQLQDEVVRRHTALWERTTVVLARAHRGAVVLRALGQLLFSAAYIGAVLMIVHEAIVGRHTVGDVALVVILAAQVNTQVAQAVALLPHFQRLTGVDRRLRELRAALTHSAAGDLTEERLPPDRLRHGIAFRNVSFTYPGTQEPVLRNVDLMLPAGATVAIVGQNGAGKSSLLKLLCGFYRPSRGEILVDGVDVYRMPLALWRTRIAAGFQDFVRYELIAQEAVGVGDLPRVGETEAVLAALDRASANDVIEQMDGGLSARLGKSYADGVELSGGQWQKLALGRAFMREQPLLLLLDEPASALDAEAEHALFERYATHAREVAAANGAITLLVSHRFSTVRMADLIVVLAEGRVAEVGDHSTLLSACGLYSELYELQARAYR